MEKENKNWKVKRKLFFFVGGERFKYQRVFGEKRVFFFFSESFSIYQNGAVNNCLEKKERGLRMNSHKFYSEFQKDVTKTNPSLKYI